MNRRKKWNHSRGFSLPQALVTVLIGSIAMVGLQGLVRTNLRSIQSVRLDSDFDSMLNTVRMVLTNPGVCGISPAVVPFYDGNGNVATYSPDAGGNSYTSDSNATRIVINPGKSPLSPILSAGTYFSFIKVNPISLPSPATPAGIRLKKAAGDIGAGTGPYLVDLIVNANKDSNSPTTTQAVGGSPISNSRSPIKLYLTIDATTKVIRTCSLTAAASTSIPAPPDCSDPTKALHWKASTQTWSCDTVTIQAGSQGGAPCGAGNKGVTMYGYAPNSTTRLCCLVSGLYGSGGHYYYHDCTVF